MKIKKTSTDNQHDIIELKPTDVFSCVGAERSVLFYKLIDETEGEYLAVNLETGQLVKFLSPFVGVYKYEAEIHIVTTHKINYWT